MTDSNETMDEITTDETTEATEETTEAKRNQDGSLRKKRASREEQRQILVDKIAKIDAQEAGTWEGGEETTILKSLEKRLSKTERVLRGAKHLVHGFTDNNGRRTPSQDEKIENTRNRLASQIEAKDRAMFLETKLPFECDTLKALIGAAKIGDVVEFPTDLTKLDNKSKKTDEEIEADFVANQETETTKL